MNELKQCTFKPDLNPSSTKYANTLQPIITKQHHHTQRSSSNLYDRNLQWLDNKESKLKVERKKDKKDEI